jgi:hypothetical protein
MRQLIGGIVLLLSVAAAAFYAGTRYATSDVEQLKGDRRAIIDTIHIIERQLVIDSVRVAATHDTAMRAREAHAASAAHVSLLSDTLVAVDSGPALPVPAAIGLELRTCRSAIRADSIDYQAIRQQLSDTRADRDKWRTYAQKGDSLYAADHPRFGFKSGVATGAGLVLAIIALLK